MNNNELLSKYDFKFKKKYGQNFLKDKNILEGIVNKAKIDNETLVIEIGVGAAALTTYLSEKAKYVVGYEIDHTLKDILNDKLGNSSNVQIIFDDFSKIKKLSPQQFIKDVLIDKYGVASIVCGTDFRFGKLSICAQ